MSSLPEVHGNNDVQFIDSEKYNAVYNNMKNVISYFQKSELHSVRKQQEDELEMLKKIQLRKLLDVGEVCHYLGVGENTARNLLNKPKNSYTVKVGNRLYANREMLDKWLNQCCGNYNGRSIL